MFNQNIRKYGIPMLSTCHYEILETREPAEEIIQIVKSTGFSYIGSRLSSLPSSGRFSTDPTPILGIQHPLLPWVPGTCSVHMKHSCL